MTTLGDYFSHPGHIGGAWGKALTTGDVSALLALGASFLLEYCAWCLRSVWTQMKTKEVQYSPHE